MNKKLIVLIVALECIFSVFLISFFGPMIASLHEDIPVSEIHLIGEDGNRLVAPEGAEMPTVEIDLPNVLDYHFGLEVLGADATDKSVTVTTDRESVTVTMDKHGRGFTVTFEPGINDATVTVVANDGSGKTAHVYIQKKGTENDGSNIFG